MSFLEFGPPIGGFAVDGRAVDPAANRKSKRSSTPSKQVLDGYACLYDVPHHYKGRTEIFSKGCFAGSLHGVFFGIDHILTDTKLGEQDDGSLQLFDTDVGLGFRLKLAPGDLERLDGRDEVSVMYQEIEVELGDSVRIIRSASLFEISAVHVGTIRKTFAEVRDANTVGTLANDAKTFASDGAAIGFLRALRNLQ